MFVINSNLIKEKLKDYNLTQYDIADGVDVKASTISLIINNNTKNLNMKVIHYLCKKLHLTIDEVIIDNNETPKTSEDYINRIDFLSNELNKTVKDFESFRLSKIANYQIKYEKFKYTNSQDTFDIIKEHNSEYDSKSNDLNRNRLDKSDLNDVFEFFENVKSENKKSIINSRHELANLIKYLNINLNDL